MNRGVSILLVFTVLISFHPAFLYEHNTISPAWVQAVWKGGAKSYSVIFFYPDKKDKLLHSTQGRQVHNVNRVSPVLRSQNISIITALQNVTMYWCSISTDDFKKKEYV